VGIGKANPLPLVTEGNL